MPSEDKWVLGAILALFLITAAIALYIATSADTSYCVNIVCN